MPKEYTKEQLLKLYEKLPEELQEAIFSMETADNIWDICEKNNVKKVSSIAKYVGQVLIGVLAPEDFQKTIEKELNLNPETAKKVSQEVHRFIFYPVRPALEKLYTIETTPSEKTLEKPKEQEKIEEEKPKTPPRKDVYRELIE